MKRITLNTFIIIISLLLFSCYKIEGEGPIIEQEISVNDFSAINLQGSFDVVISKGETQQVTARGQHNIIQRLKTKVHDGEWDIELEKGYYKHYDLTIYVVTPHLSKIELQGSGNISGSDLTEDYLSLEVEGSGNIDLRNTSTTKLKVDIEGSGHVNVAGISKTQELEIDGSGYIHLFDVMNNEETSIEINGSGHCETRAINKLDVRINGSGHVSYKGNPIISSKVLGSGHLSQQ